MEPLSNKMDPPSHRIKTLQTLLNRTNHHQTKLQKINPCQQPTNPFRHGVHIPIYSLVHLASPISFNSAIKSKPKLSKQP
jgi:hypothetical protein